MPMTSSGFLNMLVVLRGRKYNALKVLYWISTYTLSQTHTYNSLRPLVCVLSNAASVESWKRRSEHVFPILESLHCLPLASKKEFQVLFSIQGAERPAGIVSQRELLNDKSIHRSSLRSYKPESARIEVPSMGILLL